MRYIPHPKTWLNQARWEDDPEAYNSTNGDQETEDQGGWIKNKFYQ